MTQKVKPIDGGSDQAAHVKKTYSLKNWATTPSSDPGHLPKAARQ
jgi:hypothetical protein